MWLMDLPLPVTLGQNAVDGLDMGGDMGGDKGGVLRRSVFATFT